MSNVDYKNFVYFDFICRCVVCVPSPRTNNALGMSENHSFVYLHFSRRERMAEVALPHVKRHPTQVLNSLAHTYTHARTQKYINAIFEKLYYNNNAEYHWKITMGNNNILLLIAGRM